MNTRRTAICLMTAVATVSFLPTVLLAHNTPPRLGTATLRPPQNPVPKPGGGMGDGLIAQKVRRTLILDRRFKPWQVKVVSSGGTIVLNGEVETKEARVFAQSDAQKVPGVRRVVNRLKIAP